MPDLINDEISPLEKKTCIRCEASINLTAKFCSNCGIVQSDQLTNHSGNKWALIKQTALFYLIYLEVCVVSKFVNYFHTFSWLLLINAVLAITAIAFFCLDWKQNKTLLIWRNFSWPKLCAYLAIAMLASMFVQYSVDWLDITIYSQQQEYYANLKGNIFGEFLLVFFVAVVPAIFEELAFRGYLLQAFLKITDIKQAIYVSAFLFAIIHMSLISLFWLIPFALFISYVRVKENTLWYGVFIHFSFNLTACLFMLS